MVDINTNPLYFAATGGVILGLATSLNYCLRGKVTGMSGIIFNLTSCNISTIYHMQNNSQKNYRSSEECSLLLGFSSISFNMELTTTSLPTDPKT